MPWKYLHRRINAYLINLSMLQESSPLQADALFKDTFDDLCLDVKIIFQLIILILVI